MTLLPMCLSQPTLAFKIILYREETKHSFEKKSILVMDFVLHLFVTKVIKLLNHSCFSYKKKTKHLSIPPSFQELQKALGKWE